VLGWTPVDDGDATELVAVASSRAQLALALPSLVLVESVGAQLLAGGALRAMEAR
jgi:hypothetical protein